MIRFLFSLLVCSLLACSKKDIAVAAPIPTPTEPVPVTDCSLRQMVENPGAGLAPDRDTVFEIPALPVVRSTAGNAGGAFLPAGRPWFC
jgi:hypothetical protein